MEKLTKDQLQLKGLSLIPISDIEIIKDNTHKIGYDFTVEDYYTFSTSDGVFIQDCMAIYFPSTEQSIKDVNEKIGIWNNLLSPTDISIVPKPNQDIILGIYSSTKDDVSDNMKEYKNIKMTQGRINFNLCLPEDYEPINETINDKKLNTILNDISLKYSPDVVMKTLDAIKDLGFMSSTLEGYTLGIDDLYNPKLEEHANNLTGNVKEDMAYIQSNKDVKKLLEESNYAVFINSGARGSWDQTKQIVLTRGYVADATNKIRPELIRSSLVKGMSPKEYFSSCWGARKGLLDTAVSTGDSGYLTRQLIYSTVPIELDSELDDCKTEEYLELEVTSEKMAKCLLWRFYWDDELNRLRKITSYTYKKIIGKKIKLRSPIYCNSKHICKKCYGDHYKILHGNQIGIIATQAIGERTTQLVLRTFHIGGLAQGSHESDNEDIISGMSIANKLFHKPESLGITSPDQFVTMIHKIFGQYGAIRLVHYEVIITSMMWYNDKMWRVTDNRKNFPFQWVSILQTPAKHSWLLGCAFANLKSKILEGLIKNQEDNETSLTKLFDL